MPRRPPTSTLFPYTTLFRSSLTQSGRAQDPSRASASRREWGSDEHLPTANSFAGWPDRDANRAAEIGKSTRLNSSHLGISYAVFCLKKKKHTYTDLPYKSQA